MKTVFAERRRRLADLLAGKKLDGYLFQSPSDLYYLTGFQSDGLFGLAGGKDFWVFTSALLAGQVRENAPGVRLVVGKKLTAVLQDLRRRKGLKRVGFDGERIFYRLGTALSKAGLDSRPNPLEDLRAVKDAEEMAQLRRAGSITARVVDAVTPRVRPGMTELAMARMIRDRFERQGARDTAFDLIAAVGAHTALPHHQPSEAPLRRGMAVLFDVGCRVGAYRSDLTRTFYYGTIPADFRRVHRIVAEAQKAGFEAVKPGNTGGDVDRASRNVIQKAGFGRTFVHSTGHGVGIDIHEPPWNRAKSADLLKPGMVLTVEPGIYLPGRFGVRIEDTLQVTSRGYEVLTKP